MSVGWYQNIMHFEIGYMYRTQVRDMMRDKSYINRVIKSAKQIMLLFLGNCITIS